MDLFGRLPLWRAIILAGNRNHYSQDTFATDDSRFNLLRVPRQDGRAFNRFLGWIAFSVQSFLKAVSCRGVDLVYASSPQPFAALAGLAAARIRNRPFVLEVRDLWPESMVAAGRLEPRGLVYKLFLIIERLLAKQAARIVCVTDGWESHFADLGISPEKLLVVPNGADVTDFETLESRPQLRARQRISGFTAVFAGAHGTKDGIDLILEAAERLPHLNFILIGSGSAKSQAIELSSQRRILNVEFRDPVPKQRLGELLRACDVGIHAVTPLSVFDKGMSPNKLFDYMASGLPIVSNAEVALSRIFDTAECGVVGPPSGLTDCLQAVYEATDEQRHQWSSRSIELIRSRYSRTKAADILAAALDDVCKKVVDGS